MINGMIIIDKEKGFTSHDVVAKMRGICGQKNWAYRDTGSNGYRSTSYLPWKRNGMLYFIGIR